MSLSTPVYYIEKIDFSVDFIKQLTFSASSLDPRIVCGALKTKKWRKKVRCAIKHSDGRNPILHIISYLKLTYHSLFLLILC